jgi:hypothetical protein
MWQRCCQSYSNATLLADALAMASAWSLAVERSAIVRWLLRWRWLVLAVASVGSALLEVRTSGPSSDGPYFETAGGRLLSSSGLHVYAASGLQAGPLQIGGFGVLAKICTALHLPVDESFAVVSTLASTLLIVLGVRLLRRHLGLASSAMAELITGVFAVGWLLAAEVYLSGHPAELVIPAVWIAAAALATDDRVVVAGVVIGFAAGFETWSVLGVPVLLLAPTVRSAGIGLAATVGTAAALYLPFVIAGPFRMGQAQWRVASPSLVHALDPALVTFPWSARLVQSVVVVAVGSLAVWAVRRSPHRATIAVWAVPAVIALAKAVTEPSGYDWYWLPAQITLLAGCACLDGLPRPVIAVVVAAEAIAVTTPLHVWPVAVVALIGLAGVVVASGRRTPRNAARRAVQRVGSPA